MRSEPLAIAVIPARLGATRFPKKMLAPIAGKPMVLHVLDNMGQCKFVKKVVVATDSIEISSAVMEHGGEAVLTPDHFQSGTDRVAWAVRDQVFDVVVNVQGDEPLLPGSAVDQLARSVLAHRTWDIATFFVESKSEAEWNDENVVKVEADPERRALNFFRKASDFPGKFFKHVGVYAYRKEALAKFVKLPASPRELEQRLEQLRALDNQLVIGVVPLSQETIAVDVPADIGRVERQMMQYRFPSPKS